MSGTLREIGTPARPLYFLHIPKTAGSALTRLLEDVFPQGRVWPVQWHEDLAAVSEEELRRFGVYCGHFGLGLPEVLGVSPRIITLLRDPVARTWSLYRLLRPRLALPGRPIGELSLAEFLDWRQFGMTNFHAWWLAQAPVVRRLQPHDNKQWEYTFRGLDEEQLDAAARSTLRACALVGTVERMPDFISALSRLLGRWLPEPPLVNVNSSDQSITEREQALLQTGNRIDFGLLAAAEQQLDASLAMLPPLPPEPLGVLPYRQTMDQAFGGTGWHARLASDGVGWHRWTGPGTVSTIRLPARFEGSVRLDVHVVSACEDAAVRSLRSPGAGRTGRTPTRDANRGRWRRGRCRVRSEVSRGD